MSELAPFYQEVSWEMLRLLKVRQRRQIQDWEKMLEAKDKGLKAARQREGDLRRKVELLRRELLRLEGELFKERQERLNWQSAAEALSRERRGLEDALEGMLRRADEPGGA